jgi:hypothetical protein
MAAVPSGPSLDSTPHYAQVYKYRHNRTVNGRGAEWTQFGLHPPLCASLQVHLTDTADAIYEKLVRIPQFYFSIQIKFYLFIQSIVHWHITATVQFSYQLYIVLIFPLFTRSDEVILQFIL